MQRLIAVSLDLCIQLLAVPRHNMAIRAKVVHHSEFAKVAGSNEVQVGKLFFAEFAGVSSDIKIRKRLEPSIAPEHDHTAYCRLAVYLLLFVHRADGRVKSLVRLVQVSL